MSVFIPILSKGKSLEHKYSLRSFHFATGCTSEESQKKNGYGELLCPTQKNEPFLLFSVFFFFQVNFWKETRLVFLGKLFIHLPTLKLKVTAYMKSVTYNNEFDFSLIFKGQPLIFPIEDIWNSLLTAPWGNISVVLLRGA